MLLHSLIRQFDPYLPTTSLPDLEIGGICEDSRAIRPGDLFVARPGSKTDGQRFVSDARDRGAAAAIVQSAVPLVKIPQVVVKDANAAASILANLFLGLPAQKLRAMAVTGTNGKTTTTYLIRQILARMSSRCGLIGTVEIDDGRSRREASMTTPAATEIAQLLATMRDRGCRACAMEVSSHALDQGRVAGVHFAGAAFTNLTGDHLDYHKTMDSYAAAKARLFESLAPSAVAVVNAEDEWSERMVKGCPARVLRFGFGKDADYRARDAVATAKGTTFILCTPDGRAEVSTRLIGRHNIENVLTAAALVGETLGLSVQQLAAGLRDAEGAPGRLQPVRAGQPFAVLVDYAHTDDALENVLTALRPLTKGKLRVIFGCGGDRDRTKRPRMARTAGRLADVVYVTSDNPRTEDPQSIVDEILTGLTPAARSGTVVELDRRQALRRALAEAAAEDVVLIAGKGHENYQIVGTEKKHFDDVEEAVAALSSWSAAA